MKDVSGKLPTTRVATARAVLRARPETILAVTEKRVPKGDALECSRVAAVQAAKQTPMMLPFCHPLPIESVKVDYEVSSDRIAIKATVRTFAKTGVEMEALCAASAAALNLYDMLKMLDTQMVIEKVELLAKVGGKSDPLAVAGRVSIGVDADGDLAELISSRLGDFGLVPIDRGEAGVVFSSQTPIEGFVPDEDVQETVRVRMRQEMPFARAGDFSAWRKGGCLWLKLPSGDALARCALDALLPMVFLAVEAE